MTLHSVPTRRLWAMAGTAALVATLLATPAEATPFFAVAGPAYDQAGRDPLATIAQAYRHSYPGLTAEQARAAATAQRAGERLKAEIEGRWDTFGGGWFDPYTATYHLAVTTAATAEALARVGRTRGVTVRTPRVARSLDELTDQALALQAGTGALARAANENVGVDVTTNQVVAALPAHRLTDVAGAAPAGVTVVPAEDLDVEPDACTSRADCDDYLAAGLAIRNGNPGQLACSIGFTARHTSDQTRITLTAGHCSFLGQAWSNGLSNPRLIGFVLELHNSGPVDVSRIRGFSDFYHRNFLGRIASGPSSTLPVKGQSFLLTGDVVCLSASFTNPARAGNPCATVANTMDPFNRMLVRINGYDACNGDSGGGWYWLAPSGNRYAAAIHSRSTSGCNASPARSWASELRWSSNNLVYENS